MAKATLTSKLLTYLLPTSAALACAVACLVSCAKDRSFTSGATRPIAPKTLPAWVADEPPAPQPPVESPQSEPTQLNTAGQPPTTPQVSGVGSQNPAPHEPVGATACAFKKTFIFGSSVSAETILKNRNILETLGLPFSHADFGKSPGAILTAKANGQILKNEAADFDAPTGSEQIQAMLASEQEVLKSASAIIGVDAFYWDAVREKCDSALQQATQLIRFASGQKKILILGNVPMEVPEHVPLTQLPEPFHSLIHWAPPQPECVLKFRKLLQEQCQSSQRCFAVDNFAFAQTLNQEGQVETAKGKTMTLAQLRPDGVHLSSAGSKYISEQIVLQLQTVPDAILCAGTGAPSL